MAAIDNVVLDGYALNPEDLTWDGSKANKPVLDRTTILAQTAGDGRCRALV